MVLLTKSPILRTKLNNYILLHKTSEISKKNIFRAQFRPPFPLAVFWYGVNNRILMNNYLAQLLLSCLLKKEQDLYSNHTRGAIILWLLTPLPVPTPNKRLNRPRHWIRQKISSYSHQWPWDGLNNQIFQTKIQAQNLHPDSYSSLQWRKVMAPQTDWKSSIDH